MNKKTVLESARGLVEKSKEGSTFASALQTVVRSLKNHSSGKFDLIASKLSSYGDSIAKKIEDLKEKQASLDPSDTDGQRDIQKNKEDLLGLVEEMFSRALERVEKLAPDTNRKYVYNIQLYLEKLGMGLVESVQNLEKRIIAGVLLFKK